MDVWVVSFITAYLSALLWTALPSIPCSALLLGLGCLALTRLWSCKTKPYLLITSGALFGVVWIASVGHWTYFWQQSLTQTRQQVQIEGRVEEVVTTGQNHRFTLSLNRYQQTSWRLYQPRVRLNWYRTDLPLASGDKVRLWVKLKPIRGLANEGGFDYQTWLFSRGIHATGYVVAKADNQKLASAPSLRQKYLQQFYDLPLEQSAWLAALTFGDRSQLETDEWLLVQRAGIAHLIAISGLHLGLVASLVYGMCFCIFNLLLYFTKQQRLNLHMLALCTSFLSSLAYAALAGFSIPTLRALIMMGSGLFLVLFARHWSFQKFFIYNVFLFILLFPLSPFGLSFWFSFIAILSLGFIFWRWPLAKGGFNLKNWCLVMLRIQLGLSVLMLPLVGWTFSMLSALAPVVNLFAVPLVTLLLVPLCLVAILLFMLNMDIALPLLKVADYVLASAIGGLDILMLKVPLFSNLPYIPPWCWSLLTLSLLVSFLPFQHRLKYLAWLLCIPALSYLLPANPPGWKLDVLDVGQGLSVVVTRGKQTYVYDTGAAYPSGFNMADAVLLPLMKNRNIQRVEALVLSHDDNDHAGSYAALSEKVSIKQTISSRDECVAGYNHKWHDLKVRVLWPLQEVSQQQRVDNDLSCVLHITDGQFSVLLAGDISQKVELRLVELYGQQLAADVLVAAHHGSNTSTSGTFLAHVQPRYVVFSQGFMNRWQFPKAEVLARVEHLGARSLTTSGSGQISFYINGGNYKLREYRHSWAAQWYAN